MLTDFIDPLMLDKPRFVEPPAEIPPTIYIPVNNGQIIRVEYDPANISPRGCVVDYFYNGEILRVRFKTDDEYTAMVFRASSLTHEEILASIEPASTET